MEIKTTIRITLAVLMVASTAGLATAAEEFGLSVRLYGPVQERVDEGNRVSYWVKDTRLEPHSCGFFILRPRHVPEAEFPTYWEDFWKQVVNVTETGSVKQYGEDGRLRLIAVSEDPIRENHWEASNDGVVLASIRIGTFQFPNHWTRMVGIYSLRVRDRVHPIKYDCWGLTGKGNVHDSFWPYIRDVLKSAYIMPPGFHGTDWPPDTTGRGAADGNRAQCMSHCDGPFLDLHQSCMAKCLEKFSE